MCEKVQFSWVLLLGVREGAQRRERGTCACVGDGTRQVWRVLGYLLISTELYEESAYMFVLLACASEKAV